MAVPKKIQSVILALWLAIVTGYTPTGPNIRAQEKEETGKINREAEKIDAVKLFSRECSDCHGEDGRGRMLNQPDFTNREWHKSVTDRRLFKSIKFGREPMPFYLGALSDDEIRALVKYVRSLARRKEDGDKANR